VLNAGANLLCPIRSVPARSGAPRGGHSHRRWRCGRLLTAADHPLTPALRTSVSLPSSRPLGGGGGGRLVFKPHDDPILGPHHGDAILTPGGRGVCPDPPKPTKPKRDRFWYSGPSSPKNLGSPVVCIGTQLLTPPPSPPLSSLCAGPPACLISLPPKGKPLSQNQLLSYITVIKPLYKICTHFGNIFCVYLLIILSFEKNLKISSYDK